MIETINGKAYVKKGDKVYELVGGSGGGADGGSVSYKVINLNDYAIPQNGMEVKSLGELFAAAPLNIGATEQPLRVTAFADTVKALLTEFDTDATIHVVYSMEMDGMSLAYEITSVDTLRENGAIHQVSFGDTMYIGDLHGYPIGVMADIRVALNEDGSIVFSVTPLEPVHFPFPVACLDCNGTGDGGDCSTCGGEGKPPCSACSGLGERECDVCYGRGTVTEPQTCDNCGGSGNIEETCGTCGGGGTDENGEPCSSCGGVGSWSNPCGCSGGMVENEVGCTHCGGSGRIACDSCSGTGHYNEPCPECEGSGKSKCSTCGGEGMVEM